MVPSIERALGLHERRAWHDLVHWSRLLNAMEVVSVTGVAVQLATCVRAKLLTCAAVMTSHPLPRQLATGHAYCMSALALTAETGNSLNSVSLLSVLLIRCGAVSMISSALAGPACATQQQDPVSGVC